MKNRQMLDKWREFYATALFDLPAAAAQSMALSADRQGREERLGTAAWRAYDAWIWLVNETANRLYSTHLGRSSVQARQLRLVPIASQSEAQSAAGAERGFQSDNWLEAR
ncbi:MAG: hypothetical protein ACRETL_15345 [Gammaproteobacteria bacterium]